MSINKAPTMSWSQDLLEYARIQPVVNQIEVHPYMRNDYNIDFCRSKVRAALPNDDLQLPACPLLEKSCRGWSCCCVP